MKRIVRLSESDLVRIVKMVISESEVPDYLKQYIESKCVTYGERGKYIVVDVESPSYFESKGFDKSDGVKIKQKLKKDNFISVGVGEYVKKI